MPDQQAQRSREVQQTLQLLQELEGRAEEIRQLLQMLLDQLGLVVYPAATRADRHAGDLLRRVLIACSWALRLEADVGSRDPDPVITFDEDHWRVVVGRGFPSYHKQLRPLEDEELDFLLRAIRAADMDGAEQVEVAVRHGLPVDLVADLDEIAAQLDSPSDVFWRRFAENARGFSRRIQPLGQMM